MTGLRAITCLGVALTLGVTADRLVPYLAAH